jgi:hypothetical protein
VEDDHHPRLVLLLLLLLLVNNKMMIPSSAAVVIIPTVVDHAHIHSRLLAESDLEIKKAEEMKIDSEIQPAETETEVDRGRGRRGQWDVMNLVE